MSIDGAVVINNSEVIDVLGSIPGLSGLIKIGQVAGILVIVYIAFLIFKAILGFRQHKKISNLNKTLESIDKKLDKLVKQTTKKK